MVDLKGQTAVVFGLANKRSIAWAIAQKLSAAGAQIAICYQNGASAGGSGSAGRGVARCSYF